MPQHSMDALFRSLNKGQLAPVYYFHGPEDVLKDEAVHAILDQSLEPGMRDFNLDQLSAAQLDPEEVHAVCNTLPMMSERRVVLLRDVEAWKRKTKSRAAFLRYLENPSPHTLVILVQGSGEEGEDKELARGCYEVCFDPLPAERAVKWVLHQAERLGLRLEPLAAEHLVRSVGAELGALSSELAKLSSLPPDAALTAERVGELLGVRQGETLWDWRSAVLEDQSARAVVLLPRILAQPGMSGVKLVSSLGTSLIGLAVARTLYDKGLRGRTLEDAVFKALLRIRPAGLLGYKSEAASWARVVGRWPAPRLRSALRAGADADQALKSTTISDERGVLTDLVLQIGLENGGEGGDGGGRSDISKVTRGMQLATHSLFIASALSGFSAVSALSAQTDPRLVQVIRHAQEGEGDSARVKVQRLLAATSPSDSLYPQIVYTQAMVASDAADMRRQLQRVVVEHSSSSWADDALLRLVQLDYASGNLEGAARHLERLRLDYPGSPLIPPAAYWAARTYFDQKNPELACRWIAEGMSGARGNIELQNQLGYLNQRCTQLAGAGAATPRDTTNPVPVPADSARSVAAAPPDTSPVPVTRPDSAAPPPPSAQAANPPAPAPRTIVETRDTLAASRTSPAGSRYRIQITAVRNFSTARTMATRLKSRGFDVVTVEEGGLYKVRVGEYPTRADAIAALPDIKAKLGGSPFVVAES